MKPSSLFMCFALLGLTACGHHRPVYNPSGAEAAAAEAARMRDPIDEKQKQKSHDSQAIDRRAADYEHQGRSAEEAHTLAEVEYARTAK